MSKPEPRFVYVAFDRGGTARCTCLMNRFPIDGAYEDVLRVKKLDSAASKVGQMTIAENAENAVRHTC